MWGTVCDDGWDTNDARVVCRDLGFPSGKAQARTGSFSFGQGSGPIWLANVDCTGSESALYNCDHRGWGVVGSCDHSQDAGVICTDGT